MIDTDSDKFNWGCEVVDDDGIEIGLHDHNLEGVPQGLINVLISQGDEATEVALGPDACDALAQALTLLAARSRARNE